MEQKQKKEMKKESLRKYVYLTLNPEEIRTRMKTIHKLKLFYCYAYIRKI